MKTDKPPREGVRLDKWLWAARFYKTRSLAAEEVDKGRVAVNGAPAKPAREMRIGDSVQLRQGASLRTVRVEALSHQRGPAPVAQTLYAETPQSIAARAQAEEQRRMGIEPSQSMEAGRPTKRDRRKLADWSRWSASLDDDKD